MFTRISQSLFPYSISFHPAAPHQEGFWRDRYDHTLTTFGLGRTIMLVERRN